MAKYTRHIANNFKDHYVYAIMHTVINSPSIRIRHSRLVIIILLLRVIFLSIIAVMCRSSYGELLISLSTKLGTYGHHMTAKSLFFHEFLNHKIKLIMRQGTFIFHYLLKSIFIGSKKGFKQFV